MSHTAEKKNVRNTFSNFHFQLSEIYMILRDNAANIIKGIGGISYTSLSCFLYTLHLVVKDYC